MPPEPETVVGMTLKWPNATRLAAFEGFEAKMTDMLVDIADEGELLPHQIIVYDHAVFGDEALVDVVLYFPALGPAQVFMDVMDCCSAQLFNNTATFGELGAPVVTKLHKFNGYLASPPPPAPPKTTKFTESVEFYSLLAIILGLFLLIVLYLARFYCFPSKESPVQDYIHEQQKEEGSYEAAMMGTRMSIYEYKQGGKSLHAHRLLPHANVTKFEKTDGKMDQGVRYDEPEKALSGFYTKKDPWQPNMLQLRGLRKVPDPAVPESDPEAANALELEGGDSAVPKVEGEGGEGEEEGFVLWTGTHVWDNSRL